MSLKVRPRGVLLALLGADVFSLHVKNCYQVMWPSQLDRALQQNRFQGHSHKSCRDEMRIFCCAFTFAFANELPVRVDVCIVVDDQLTGAVLHDAPVREAALLCAHNSDGLPDRDCGVFRVPQNDRMLAQATVFRTAEQVCKTSGVKCVSVMKTWIVFLCTNNRKKTNNFCPCCLAPLLLTFCIFVC